MLIIIVAPIICLMLYATRHTCSMYSNDKPVITPANSIFIFDIHGVLLIHDYRCMWRIFRQSPYKWQLLAILFKPKFLYRIVIAFFSDTLAQTLYIHLAHLKIKPEVLQLYVSIANCQRINWPVIHLVRQLKDRGYKLGILSNISEDLFLNLETRHVDIFTLFDPILTTSAYANFAAKPSPIVYQHLLQEVAAAHEHIIFIDDNQKNICGSIPFGIIALRYRTIDQLTKEIAGLDPHTI